jgi:hypothetical protein
MVIQNGKIAAFDRMDDLLAGDVTLSQYYRRNVEVGGA